MDSQGVLVEVTLTIVGLLIAGTVGWFTIVPAIDKTRRDFLEIQPNVIAGRIYVVSSGDQYTAVLKLHNLGKTSAYNAKISVDGVLGNKEVPIIHPLQPGYNEYEASLELEKTCSLRTTAMGNPCMRIVYQDRWNYRYDLSYPITQSKRADGLFNINIRTEMPSLKRPKISFFKMRAHLKEVPAGH